MSTCQVCHENDAVVHLTELVADHVKTLHLCGRCAAERGIVSETSFGTPPFEGFLAGLSPAAGLGDDPSGSVCPECGATLADIQASGRIGCPTCWLAFERPLRELVRRLHGATRHTGESASEVSELDGGGHDRAAVGRLRRELRIAIAAEEFERAAVLRDQLQSLEEPDDR